MPLPFFRFSFKSLILTILIVGCLFSLGVSVFAKGVTGSGTTYTKGNLPSWMGFTGLWTWGSTPKGGAGGLTYEDAIAAMGMIIQGKFNDPAFIKALLAYMAVHPEAYTSTDPKQLVKDLSTWLQENYKGSLEQALLKSKTEDIYQNRIGGNIPDAELPTLNEGIKKARTQYQAATEAADAFTNMTPEQRERYLFDTYGRVTNDKQKQEIQALYLSLPNYKLNESGLGIEYYDPKEGKWKMDNNANNYLAGKLPLDSGSACDDAFDAGPLSEKGGGGEGGGGDETGGGQTGGGATSSKCTSYTYGAWGACINGTQTRTLASQSPSGCTDTSSAALSQSCTSAKPVVASITNASQTTASPVLSVYTDRPANCQYNESGGFTYGSGTTLDTTGNINHNTTLRNLSNGTHTYYVICKDNASGGVSDALKVEFKVDLSQDPANAPAVESVTATNQTTNSPTLGVTTDRKSTCQYKEGSTFTYGAGTSMTTSDNYSHSVSLTSLADGSHTFYVVCKDNNTGAVSSAKQITTSLNRSGNTGEAPVITNTTDTYQTVGNPTISITTTRAATCQYKDSSFSYGSGTQFQVDGATVHSAQLSNASDGQYTYYAVCKDTASGTTNSSPTQIIFTVAASAPTVNNITPGSQTTNTPVLSVTTDRKSTCQYKEGSTFTYGAGTSMTTSDNYSHSVSLTSLADGSHTFYVVCKDSNTGATSPAKQITTSLNRSGNMGDAPMITNVTAGYQTTNNPTLAVTTDKAAVCQYGSNNFSYGSGTQFGADGGTVHSVQLKNVSDGQHSYYVVCKDNASGLVSVPAQIIFTVNTSGGGNTCANLTSNDRLNDSHRSYSGTSEDSSVYPWRAVEEGTRERFAKVDWYAGYQFTPNRNGKITQLCGYFDSGIANQVFISDGAYNVLVDARITGTGSWKCVDVSPLTVSADKRYYVVARVENNPIYFEYKPALLPKLSGNVLIEAGIRQSNVKGVPGDIIKYDYMVFGLVDFKISFAPADPTGPVITSAGPAGTVNSTSVQIEAQTEANASCRFGREDVEYALMDYPLPKASANVYRQKICGLENGTYTFYVRCQSAGGAANNVSKQIQFTVSQ